MPSHTPHTPSVHHNHPTSISRKNNHNYSNNDKFIPDKSEHLYQLQLQRQQQKQFYDQLKDISMPIYEDHNYLQFQENRDSDGRSSQSNHRLQPQLYQLPNLYKLSLQLTTELNIHKWWDNVIDIFTSSYYATRILLSVPHDLTDTVNTPWGVKAMYNKNFYCNSNTCYSESATDSCSSSSSDTGHSVFENLRGFDCDSEPLVDNSGILKILHCGKIVVLSREYRLPSDENTSKNKDNYSNFNSEMKNHWSRFRKNLRSTENKGVQKNLGWDNVKDNHCTDEQGSSRARVLDTPCLNNLEEGQGNYFQDDLFDIEKSSSYHHRLSDYEEFEQQQPSPWSQSPAPSPAVTDLNCNPFFQAIPEIDDEAFNPSSSSTSSPELHSSHNFNYPAITDNNVYSIVHIPLIHPTTVKNVVPTNTNRAPVPIAILSFLSCLVPYPSDLINSLKGLAPFLATTLSVSMIHQQSVVQLSCTTPTRLERRRSSQHSNMTATPFSTDSLVDDDEFSLSSGECSTASTNSSKWTAYGCSPSLDSDNEMNSFSNIQDFTRSDSYEHTPVSDTIPHPHTFITSRRSAKNQDLLGRGWIEVIHPDDRANVLEMWNTTFLRGEGSSANYRMKRFDGQYRWFLGRAGPLRDARGVNIRWFGTCIDVHDQKLAEQRQSRQLHIEASEKKYRLLADAIPQIVFTATPKDGITYVNDKWLAYSGQTEEQAKNLGFLSHVHPDDRAICRLPEDTAPDMEMVLEQKLKEAHDAAKRSMEKIRTPLIGITGMINFMLATNLTTEQLDYAHTIQQSADALLLVINDILDLSKVEAGMMKLEMEPFSLHNMIEDTNELLSTLAIQKGLELSFIVDDNVPNVVCGDRVRLRQVLLNVIGNAIKFTSKGEVFSRCSIHPEESGINESEVMLLFEVVDTGDGFDSGEEAAMFKPFSQVDTSVNPRPSTPTSEEFNPFLRISKFAVQNDISYSSSNLQPLNLTSSPVSTVCQNSPESTVCQNSPVSTVCQTLEPSLPNPFGCIESNNNNNGSLPELILPSSKTSTPTISRPSTPSSKIRKVNLLHPVCVLIVADLPRSRETLVHYVRSILPKSPTPDIDITCNYDEANDRLTSSEIKSYTHIIINLVSQDHIILLSTKIKNLTHLSLTITVILTTPIQRAGIMEGARNDLPERVDFILKPLNRTKMEGLFDHTTTVRDNFLRRRNTHQIVASQREVFKRMADAVGDKGFKVLLVEDNFVNQKAEIRSWEAEHLTDEPPIPIIALTANVMSDVAEKCFEVGFTSYVSKPVSFSKLSD
ncbi:9287_t:CDS:2, partial [Racocetra fulgida]